MANQTKFTPGADVCHRINCSVAQGGLGQQRDDGGGCTTMRERQEIVESPGEYVTG